MSTSAPSVSLREITSANRTAVEAVAVTAVQAGYVARVVRSLIEVGVELEWPRFRCHQRLDRYGGELVLAQHLLVVGR